MHARPPRAPLQPTALLRPRTPSNATHLPIYDTMAPPAQATPASANIQISCTLPRRTGISDAAHLSHKISPTSLLTSSRSHNCVNVTTFRVFKCTHCCSSYKKTLRIKNKKSIHTKTTFHKKNIKHNAFPTITIVSCPLTSAKQSGIKNKLTRVN